MPHFSARSLANLSTVHPDLQCVFLEVIKHFDCTIVEGHRDQVAQDKAYKEGKSTLKWPNGKHNARPAMAVDVYPYPILLSPSNATEALLYKLRMAFFAGQVLAIARQLLADGTITHAVIWGADWNADTELRDHDFLDFPHFELQAHGQST